MKKLVIVPRNWEKHQEIIANLNKDVEHQIYDDLNKVFGNIRELVKKYDRVVLVNEDAILPFMYCSKIRGLVAAPVFDEHSAYMTPLHNNTKLMCMGYEITTPIIMNSSIKIFFKTPYEGERHVARIEMLDLELKGEQ